MAYPHFRSQFGDTTLTKVFVGGLAWETPTEELRGYFDQFGDILEAVIIIDKNTGKSKGYGFVTFRDPDSARRACANPNPVIDGRRANCNIAAHGRTRPSPPRVKNQQTTAAYNGQVGVPVPPPPPMIFPSYGYPTYTPEYGYHQAMYNPQVLLQQQQQQQQQQYYNSQQFYQGTSSSNTPYPPYYYGGYPRGTFSASPHPQRIPPGPSSSSYIYYPATTTQLDQQSFSSSTYPSPSSSFQPTGPVRHFDPSPPESQNPKQAIATSETEAGVVTSESTSTL